MKYTIIHDNFTNEDFDFVPSDVLSSCDDWWNFVILGERAEHSFTTRETDTLYAVYLNSKEGRYFDNESDAHKFAAKIGAIVQPFATTEDIEALEQA